MKKYEYKLQIAGLEEVVEAINQELVELRAFKEGVKAGQKIDFKFSPTINHAPKKYFAPGGFVGRADVASGESKEGVWLKGRTSTDLKPEIREFCKTLEKPNLKETENHALDSAKYNFEQQPFNSSEVIRHDHDKDGCFFLVDKVDFLHNIMDAKKEFFYYINDNDTSIVIIKDLEDLRTAQRKDRPILFRWVRQ